MIYLIYGSDTLRSHKELKRLVAQFLKKDGSPSIFRIDSESFSETYFNDILKTEDLFLSKKLVILKRLINEHPGFEYIEKRLEEMASSPNLFIVWEENIKSEELKKLKKKIENVFEFQSGKVHQSAERKRFSDKGDIFRVTDSFMSKQKEKTWLLCQETFLDGVPAEDVFWKIVWQVKNLLLVKSGGGKELHPFVYGKTKKSAHKFSEKELHQYSAELVDLYHEGRQGRRDIEAGLERFILRM